MFSFDGGMITDKGDVRTENQDSILYLTGEVNGNAAALFIIADGMGGLSYGAEVSRYITTQFERWWYEDFPQMIMEGMEREEDIRELLEQEIWDINQTILDFNHRLKCRAGSTISLLLLYKTQYYIENIGDSRIYLMRDQQVHQLTKDQSLTARMVRDHLMTEEEAKHSKMKNILTMCIGMFPVPECGYLSERLIDGDCFLLCSDGLYHPMERKHIENILGAAILDAKEKAAELRRSIKQGYARDNVSAIVVGVRAERKSQLRK